jgi:hypothetical protein
VPPQKNGRILANPPGQGRLDRAHEIHLGLDDVLIGAIRHQAFSAGPRMSLPLR